MLKECGDVLLDNGVGDLVENQIFVLATNILKAESDGQLGPAGEEESQADRCKAFCLR